MSTSVAELTAGMSLDERAALAGRVRAQAARLRTIRECPTPLDLACRSDSSTVRTAALELLALRLKAATTQRDGRLVVSIPPQEGKCLDIDTPILTTAGWSTMGELQVGDEVFHPDGHPAAVTEAHPVRRDRPCYRVTTTDGRSVVADGEHLWTVQDKRRERSSGPRGARVRSFAWETLTTEQLLSRGLLRDEGTRANGTPHRAYAYRLPRQEALVSKPVDLPVDPYLLGAWLGDGSSTAAQLTVGDQDIDEMTALVEATGARIVSARRDRSAWCLRFNTGGAMRDGFESRCRRLGVWGDKHVPDLYLTAGTEQRLALLQGLLDTDGTIGSNGTTSRVTFTACRRNLADAVLYLARSLGWRATVHEGAAMLDGVEVGRRWVVGFTPEQGGHVPFRLRRKADRVQVSKARAGELHAVSIAAIEPVESRPVRCIRVDRADGLFLAGRDLVATHNTTLLRWLCVWLLADDPERRVVLASYAASLARSSGRIVRTHIKTHGEALGLAVSQDHADASDWQLEGHGGGVVTTGVGGALTGRPADVLIVDDPIRNQQDADSTTVRDNLHDWWSSVALTRLAPGAPVIVVQTRWHEDDLAGRMEADGWPVVNIPALADGQTPDTLGREPGVWLDSARGRTDGDWEKKRKDVGERTFAALFQGRPAPLEGGVFKTAWFDTWRVVEPPEGCLPPTVVVDPADNEGTGDEAGILVVTQHPATGRVYILDDLSAPMTVARWARTALLVCVRRDAPTLAYEQSLSQLPNRIREAWAELHLQASALVRGGSHAAALDRLTLADDTAERRAATEQALAELTPADATLIVGIGEAGPQLRPITAKGSKESRMLWAGPLFETGRAVMVGRHQKLEFQASTWQPGQSSPDRVDAMVHACALEIAPTPRVRWL